MNRRSIEMSTRLTSQQRAQLEAMLRQRQEALRKRVATQLGGMSRVEHARELLLQDGDDATQRDADREVDLAVTDMEGAEFAAIERSLERLAAGSYGECVDCGALVPFKRLELEPHAERCVGCAAKLERRAPRPPSM
jgi:DnaK suppressor protein